jgi:peptidoglycan/xylan/chitin deacetylase (PgdA/CDA1 family)
VDPERFREHLRILREKRVPIRSLEGLLRPECRDGVAITFDDGFENFAEEAWPALREHEAPATVFVATDWVGRTNGWDAADPRIPDLPLMGWETLRALAAEGIEIGSHSRTHRRLPALSDDELARELAGARATIASEVGREPAAFAYPYGDHDARVARAVGAAGHSAAVTTELRPLERSEPSRLTLPRLDAYYLAKPGIMEGWGSGGLSRYLRFRRAARSVRAILRPRARA